MKEMLSYELQHKYTKEQIKTMSNEIIVVKITKSGDTQVSVENFSGEGCQALTAAIESRLGEIASDSKTEEFYQTGDACELRTANN
jgi:hypothetical protein